MTPPTPTAPSRPRGTAVLLMQQTLSRLRVVCLNCACDVQDKGYAPPRAGRWVKADGVCAMIFIMHPVV